MTGWIYLIRNGDLYKIGITENIERRIKQLKPDEVITKVQTNDYLMLEKKAHKLFRSKRLPQSEYFRLDRSEVLKCKKFIEKNYIDITYKIIEYIVNYILGGLLLISAIKPTYHYFIKLHFPDSISKEFKNDTTYHIRFIAGAWLIITTKLKEKSIKKN